MAQIIPENRVTVESHWQKELAQAFKDPEKLLNELDLDVSLYEPDIKARRLFPMMVPRDFVKRMHKRQPDDPLLRQVLPLKEEFVAHPGYSADPLLEQSNQTPGLLHKYQSRVLLVVKGGCAVNCRYCFRRHFPYGDNTLDKNKWFEVFDYIRQDKAINEVIFSGGDPLMANDRQLAWMTEQIQSIEQINSADSYSTTCGDPRAD